MKEKIRELRELRGLSQNGLARVAGVDQKTISNAESGKDISVRILKKIAVALEMPPAYFLS